MQSLPTSTVSHLAPPSATLHTFCRWGCLLWLLCGYALAAVQTRLAQANETPHPSRAGDAAPIEGETLNAQVTGGAAQPQAMHGFSADQWSGDNQLWWVGAHPGDRLSLELDAFKDIAAIELVLTRAPDYAIVQLELDGNPLGEPIDGYASQVETTGLLRFATPQMTTGKHKLSLAIVGANERAAKAYMVGLDFLRFRSVESEAANSEATQGSPDTATAHDDRSPPQPLVELKTRGAPPVDLRHDDYPHRGLDPQAAAAAMRLPDGFRVSVCSSEPDIKQPIAMALDDRGRTWVAEAYEYPQRAAGDQGRDRILIFEDTTGDGHFDSRKVFAEGLNLISGLEVGFGGVWVGAAPYLMFLPDADGDDVSDGPPQILLDGWGYHDTHETLNTFCWGPDGWLYGCHGVFTHSRVGKPGTPDAQRTPINAGVWRYHPLRHQFEVFAEGTSNPWGVDFNDHGEAFVTACVIPHLYHMIPGGRYQRQAGEHFNPHTYDDIKTIADHFHYLGATPHSGNGKSDEAGGGHAHAGAMFYQGGAWPDRYRDALFMNNIHGQRLNTDLLEPAGSGYVGHHGPDFLLTGDQASQILNMRYGPDGQVLMIDWYDMQACHRPEVEVHDRTNGRIYKISYGESNYVAVDLRTWDDPKLAELCLHDNDWYVRHSRRLLQERASQRDIDRAAIERLEQIATSHSDETRRLRAMWALHVISPFDMQLMGRIMRDANPHVRGWLLRLIFEQQGFQISSEQLAHLTAFATNDPSAVVRRDIASIATRLPAEQRWELVAALANHAQDAADHNLPLLYWYAMEPLADLDPDRALALATSESQHIPLLLNFMLRRIGSAGDSAAIERLISGLGRTEDVTQQQAFLDALRTALVGQRSAALPSQWEAIYARLSHSKDEQIQLSAAGLGVTFGDPRAINRLERELADASRPTASRLSAMSSLLTARRDVVPTLLALVAAKDQPDELRESALRGLAQYDNSEIGPALVAAYDSLNPAQRRSAVATLAARASSARPLLTAMGTGTIPPADLPADLVRQIRLMDDEEVQRLLQENWGQVRESSADKAAIMEQLKQLVERKDLEKADPRLGRELYAKTCQRCHKLFGIGEKLGPDLTGSNRANLDYLLENIVDPSAVMAHEYRQSIFLTEDGQVITGLLRSETDKALTVQTAEALVVIPTDEIAERKTSELSMMPDNQLQQFSEHEIRSLIAYLRSKNQVDLAP